MAALPGSQLSMKAGDGTPLRTLADSAPVAVLQANSFSKMRIKADLAQLLRGLLQLVIHRFAIGGLIIEAPEVKAADAVGGELFGQFDGAIENFTLLVVGKVRVKLIVFRAELRFRRAGEVHFEERAGDIGDAQACSFSRMRCASAISLASRAAIFLFHMLRSSIHSMPNFCGGDFAGVAEVLRDLVVDDGNLERRFAETQGLGARRRMGREWLKVCPWRQPVIPGRQ